MVNWKIKKTEIQDLDAVCALYDDAIAFQKRKGYPQYLWNDKEVQRKYINNGTHFKLVIDDRIAGMFNLQPSDPVVWRYRDIGTSVYLHGVLIHTDFKGQGLFTHILNASIQYAKSNDKTNIRIDTWDNNPPLNNHYLKFGFEIVEHFQIPSGKHVPLNCRGNEVVLMEYTVQ